MTDILELANSLTIGELARILAIRQSDIIVWNQIQKPCFENKLLKTDSHLDRVIGVAINGSSVQLQVETISMDIPIEWDWTAWSDPNCTKWGTDYHPSYMEIIEEAESLGFVEIENEPEDNESDEMCDWVDANQEAALEYIWHLLKYKGSGPKPRAQVHLPK